MNVNRTKSPAGEADERPFDPRRDAPYLALVLPQAWLYVTLRAFDAGRAPGAPLPFYLAEALGFALVFALGLRGARGGERALLAPGVARPLALCMTATPLLACFAAPASPACGLIAQVLGGVGLAWAYLAYFLTCAGLSARRAVWCLLVSFAVVPVMRLPLDLMPLAPACALSALCPALFALLTCRVAKRLPESAEASSREQGLHSPTSVLPLLMQAVAFGLAMGLFRLDAAGAQGSARFVLAALVAKVALPALILLAVERLWMRVSMATICQAAMALITLALVAAMNLPQLPAVMFGVFDFARYAMVVLVFLSATSLARRHPSASPSGVLCAAMGTYVASVAAGLAISRLAGFSDALSGTVALDVVCALVVVTLVANNVGFDTDARLFSDGRAEDAPVQPADAINARCEEAAARYRLAPREVETMKLICRGRSKKYIAEQLSLSENTVRGYAKTLYAKLDIHSRQELLTLLGIE